MNRGTGEMGPLQVIVDDAADRRFAGRLVRAGLPVASVPQRSLGKPVHGNVYIAAGAHIASIDVRHIARAGAHLWLMPPFPAQILTLATGDVVTFAPAGRREGVHLARPIVEAIGSSSVPAHPLRILYRDRIAGGVSVSLAESAEGEMLAGAMPRLSNLHGQIVASSLMLGTASAQTDLDDVAIFVRSLVDWCVASETVPAGDAAIPQQQVSTAISSEHDAQLVLLALALAIAATPLDTSDPTPVSLAVVQHVFERIGARLGEVPNGQSLAAGWRWLHELGVLLDAPAGAGEEATRLDPAKMRELIQMWQLQPRLRRLSRMPLQ